MPAPSEQTPAPPLQAPLGDRALAGEWVLEPRTSSIRLKTRSMWGLAPVNGVFREVTGSGTVWPDGKVNGTVTVGAASIDTGNARRDTHLRSADFFDSCNTPDITFTADSVQAAGQTVTVTGALTVRGRTRPLSFDATAVVQGEGQILLDAETVINRADFGLTWNLLGMASVINTITIHAVFTQLRAHSHCGG